MATGSFLGLRSLVLDENHLTTAHCEEESVFYSLDREAHDKLVKKNPKAARVLELAMARYLSHRLRHVSNRIYKERSVPV
jgi:CRP-like cAMP-binding protein